MFVYLVYCEKKSREFPVIRHICVFHGRQDRYGVHLTGCVIGAYEPLRLIPKVRDCHTDATTVHTTSMEINIKETTDSASFRLHILLQSHRITHHLFPTTDVDRLCFRGGITADI